MDIKDLMILANNLRQERLLVNSEQEALQSLNEHVATNSLQVYQCSWIKCQQRINLNKLTIARSNYSPANCCQKANALATTKFVEAQKILRYQDVQAYSEFLQFLRCSPELVATCLTAGDQVAPEAIQRVCCSLITGLYGTCLLPEDTQYVLQVLKCLMEMQLMLSEDPRRMLRNGSCAFSRLYLIFHEGLFSAKLFLSAALKEPVLHLLMEEEAYLDMDPDIAATRNPADEMLKKLGKDEHRKWTMNTLVNITNQFVMSLREHWVLFPNNVTWLVHQMVIMLRKQNFANKKVKAMCTDLIFTHLICPAIVCPERCGVTEVQISSVQQFNLMQIAQIVQMLALSQNHEVDPKFRELYGRFDKNCLSSLLDSLTEISDETVTITQEPSRDMPRLNRTSLMFTLQELNTFVSYFQLVVDQSSQQNNEGSNCLDSAYKSQLTRLLANLPTNCESQKRISPNLSNAVSPESPKKGLLGKASKTRLGRYGGNSGDGQSSSVEDSSPINNAASCPLLMSDDNRNIIEDVLVIPLPGGEIEPLGLLPENEVLAMDPSNAIDIPNEVARQNPILPDLSLNQADVQSRQPGGRTLPGGAGITNEKRTRFSLSHEEGSIGNTSDNIEVVSEAASNHSVASSLELENEDQNDNLSDMTSANVSGRGTPNISGRDTPSSQVTEGGAPELRPAPTNSNAQKSLKQSRSDIQDKFCKFEIKKLLEGDETVSIISDTWSTDVLASDSEAVESGYERNYPTPLLGGHSFANRLSMPPVPVLLERNNRIMIAPPSVDRLLDASETASESAWSTDVLASDSERMTEIDTDDCHSVARSDTDTARSEVDIDHAQDNPGGGDNQQQVQNQLPQPTPRFPSPLSPIVNVSPIFAPQMVRRDVEQMPNDSSMLDGAVQLRTRNSSSSSASSNRPSGVNGLASILQNHHQTINNLPSHNSTMNSFDSGDGSVFHGSYQNQQIHNKNDTPRSDTSSSGLSSAQQQNPIGLFNGNNTNTVITNNDMFHSMSSPFVSAMASVATRSNGFLLDSASFSNDNRGRNYAERKFSDDLVPDSSMLVNNLNSGAVFRPIQGTSGSSIHQDIGCEMNFNVTGRGGSLSDYRRRTMEYVDSNANNSSLIPHSPGSNEDILDHGESVTTNEIDFTVGTIANNSDRFSSVDLANNSQDGGLATLVSRLNISVADSLFNNTDLHNRIEASVKTSEKRTVIEKREEDAEPNIDVVACPVFDGTIPIPGTSKSSTGAIPKSISFDSTADKYHRDYDASSSVRRGMGNMFNKLKQGFRSRRGKGRALDDSRGYEDYELSRNCRRQGIQTEDEMGLERPAINNQDTTEDILAKYRRKISTSSEAATSGTSDSTGSNSSSKHKNAHHIVERHEKRLRNSVSAVEPSCSYEDAKYKLRFVLSTVDLQNMDFNRNCPQLESTLMSFLRMQLSESAALDDGPLSVQLHEAIRSVEAIGTPSEIELCRELQFDYEARALYIQYLVNTRKILLQTLAYLDRILARISVERQACDEHLVRVCVRMFLENREAQVNAFCDDFRALGLSDEKMDLLEGFLNELHGEMLRDQNWQAASEEQLIAASLSIERIVMGRVYLNALYPNGDGDIARDKVLHAHIERLSSVVTVTHKDLRIPPRHQRAAPWPHSQQLLRRMSAYRAARDKARCVARCVTSILHVLAMSQDGGCPAADDLVPVLVFILIKANPPALLSTVQYVNSFYGSSLQGAEHYWWIQFCSAIEFIKTMDEND